MKLKIERDDNTRSFFKMVDKDLKAKMFFEMIESIETETNEDELEMLSSHKIDGIRLLVASNLNTNSRTLKFLSFDDKEEIRIAAKSNKNFVETKIEKTEIKRVSFLSLISSFFTRRNKLRLA